MELFPFFFITGVVVGVFALDLCTRFKDQKDRALVSEQLKETLAKLADAHNNVIEQMKSLGDRVNAHEFTLKSKHDSKDNLSGIGGKRFQ